MGEGLEFKGGIDILSGTNVITPQEAASGRQGLDLSTNPFTALSVPFTTPKDAIAIGSLASGAMGVQDLNEAPTTLPEAFNKAASAWSIHDAIPAAEQVVKGMRGVINRLPSLPPTFF